VSDDIIVKQNEMLIGLLDTILRVVAWSAVDGRTLTESARFLSRLGLDRNQIAAICDTTPQTVSVRLSEAKRGAKPARQRGPMREQAK
jgi:hypothetical protein